MFADLGLPASQRANAGATLFAIEGICAPKLRASGLSRLVGVPTPGFFAGIPASLPLSTPSLTDRELRQAVAAAEQPLPLDSSRMPLGYVPSPEEQAERSATATVQRYLRTLPPQRQPAPELPAPIPPAPPAASFVAPPLSTAPPVISVPSTILDQPPGVGGKGTDSTGGRGLRPRSVPNRRGSASPLGEAAHQAERYARRLGTFSGPEFDLFPLR
jgi:hypothetical protein